MNTWRSYLFVPAKKPSVMKKAVFSDADSVIFDLEDAVAQSEKDNARSLIKEALSEFKDEKPIYIRINDMSTPYWEEDLKTAVSYGAKGVIVPKSEDQEGTRLVCNKVKGISKKADFEVIPLLETAKGVQFAYEIASADSLVTNLAFGYIDFSLDVGCEVTSGEEELLYARSRIVIASRAASKEPPIDAVYPDLQNPEGLRNETTLAKRLGFRGKLIIHPKQIETVHQVFAPGEQELQEATEIVEKFEEAERQGVASISVNNKLVDYPVYKKAKEMLAFYGNMTS